MPKAPYNQSESPVSDALKAQGYIKLPRLWVRAEDMEIIHQLAHKYADDVNEIRARANNQAQGFSGPRPDPKHDRDAAWIEAERLRTSN